MSKIVVTPGAPIVCTTCAALQDCSQFARYTATECSEYVKDEHPAYITVYKPIAGWKAIMLAWYVDDDSPEGMYDVVQTGMWAFGEKEEAEADAKEWAESECVEYREYTGKEK